MSVLIYWLAIRAYAIVLRIASLFHPKAKAFFAGRKRLLHHIRYTLIDDKRPRIWVHCASLGEFEQGRPVIEELKAKYPGHAIVLTFFSPSGYEAIKDYKGVDHIFYLPLDSLFNAKRFLDFIKPQLCVFVKYELWYFYLSQAARKDIPVLLIASAFRKDQPFFQWYGRLHRHMLHCFSQIFVQDVHSWHLLSKISVENVTIGGDTRFDRVVEASLIKRDLPQMEEFCGEHKILIAGSTWKEDDVFLQKVLSQLPQNWKLVLVPHEVHEARIADAEATFNYATVRWSKWQTGVDKRVLIVDKIGLLLQLYRYADVAWVGGGFGKDGVHNILEAAVYGLPVGFGPVFNKYIEAKELLALKGAITTTDADVFVQLLVSWENDNYTYVQMSEAARNYVYSKTGATQKIVHYIDEKNWLSIL